MLALQRESRNDPAMVDGSLVPAALWPVPVCLSQLPRNADLSQPTPHHPLHVPDLWRALLALVHGTLLLSAGSAAGGQEEHAGPHLLSLRYSLLCYLMWGEAPVALKPLDCQRKHAVSDTLKEIFIPFGLHKIKELEKSFSKPL